MHLRPVSFAMSPRYAAGLEGLLEGDEVTIVPSDRACPSFQGLALSAAANMLRPV